MRFRWNRGAAAVLFASLAMGAGGIGCDTDRPTSYGRQRPPVDELDPRDRGLQSSDVLKASAGLSEKQLRFLAARSFRYDRQLGDYNTAPSPAEIKDIVGRQENAGRVREQNVSPPAPEEAPNE